MKLLTEKQVEIEAAKGPEAARACSELHWRQGLALAESKRGVELREAFKRGLWGRGGGFCALCYRHHSWTLSRGGHCEDTCFLITKNKANQCSLVDSLWKKVSRTIEQWYKRQSGGSILKVRSTMKAMIKALESKE